MQTAVAQFCVSIRVEQACPTAFGDVFTVRVLVIVPVPQVAEHAPQLCHDDTTQSMAAEGQSSVWQLAVCASAGHGAPLPACFVRICRFRVWLPVPQVAEHWDHGSQLLTLQSEEQSLDLQLATSWSRPQFEASSGMGPVIARVRVRVPRPQVLLHIDQADHPDTLQRAGAVLAALALQLSPVQDSVWIRDGHLAPVPDEPLETVRIRLCVHAGVQDVHAVQSVTWQSRLPESWPIWALTGAPRNATATRKPPP